LVQRLSVTNRRPRLWGADEGAKRTAVRVPVEHQGVLIAMTFWNPVIAVALSLLASSANCLEETESFPESALTADQWQQRVMDARRRSEEYVAKARARIASPAQPDQEEAEAADQRAMNDPSLQRGDMIATSRGFLVFTGDDRNQRTPADFSPVFEPRRPQ
jgi:hypothetical protein